MIDYIIIHREGLINKFNEGVIPNSGIFDQGEYNEYLLDTFVDFLKHELSVNLSLNYEELDLIINKEFVNILLRS